jgi:hypothetical protein
LSVLAMVIAQRLAPAAWALGGFASAELEVRVGRRPPCRPAAAVVIGPYPLRPVVRAGPLLVVELAPDCAPQRWLVRGVAEVWSVGADGAWVSRRDGPPRWVPAPQPLTLHVAGGDDGPARAVGGTLGLDQPVHGSASSAATAARANPRGAGPMG